jgi:hypothetical protein
VIEETDCFSKPFNWLQFYVFPNALHQCDQMSLRKNRPKCSPSHFFDKIHTKLISVKKRSLPKWATAVIFQKNFLQSPKIRKYAKSGVDVMITFFCDFCQFSAKKMAFFSKTNVMINFLQKLAVV